METTRVVPGHELAVGEGHEHVRLVVPRDGVDHGVELVGDVPPRPPAPAPAPAPYPPRACRPRRGASDAAAA